MSTVTNSGVNAITTVLGVITTTAKTIDRTVSTIDCATAVMQNKAQHWANVTNQITALRSKASVILGTTDVQQEIAARLKQHATFAAEGDNAQYLAQAQALLSA